jgi:hypothetical protein
MKTCLIIAFLTVQLSTIAQSATAKRNIFIITTDGFRWQEVFKGADSILIRDSRCVSDTGLIKQQYWDETTEKRRERLLPFFWNVIAKQGQILGNRDYKNDVNVSNLYKISYPGYSEIFTGFADKKFVPNLSVRNRNDNILDYLNDQKEYYGHVAAFSSWNVLPFILDEKKGGVPVNSGYELLDEKEDSVNMLINQVQNNVTHKGNTRHDMLTYASAKTYIEHKHPKILFLGLGETDEYAHKGEYDHYLQKAHQVDEMIAELWYYVQTDPFYKNNTTFIITTDHGRGRKPANWNAHGFWIRGSGETWMAILGQGIVPAGEVKEKQQLYQSQIAATISMLLGESFTANHTVNSPIPLKQNDNSAEKNTILTLTSLNK